MSETLTASELVEKIRKQFPDPYEQYIEVKNKIEERQIIIDQTLDTLRDSFSTLLNWKKSDYEKKIYTIRDLLINIDLDQNVKSLRKPNWYQPSKGGLVKYKLDRFDYLNSGKPAPAPDNYIEQITENAKQRQYLQMKGYEEIDLILRVLEDFLDSSEKESVLMNLKNYTEQADYLIVLNKTAKDIISYGENYAPTNIIEMNSNIEKFTKIIGIDFDKCSKLVKAQFFTTHFKLREGKIILKNKTKIYFLTALIYSLLDYKLISIKVFKLESIIYDTSIVTKNKDKYLSEFKTRNQNYKFMYEYFHHKIAELYQK